MNCAGTLARQRGMVSFNEAFEQFALRILPPSLSDAAHLQFRQLARPFPIAPDQSLEFADSGQQIVYVAQGSTKLVAHASRSRDQIVAFHFAGDVFTVPAPDNYSYSVGTLKEGAILTFASDEFLALAASEPGVLAHLLDNTTLSLRRCREKTIALGRKTAGERIAVFLLSMAERIGAPQDDMLALELPMSRRDIAESLGLTIETVSRQFTRLKEDGVIETFGRSGVVLREPERLRDRAGFLREAA